MDGFRSFSGHWIGAFIILILAVDAGLLAQKLLVSRFNNSGITGAIKSAVMTI
jgi:hypothetical protein